MTQMADNSHFGLILVYPFVVISEEIFRILGREFRFAPDTSR